MRFMKSYGLALLIVLGIAAWMLTGTLIEGGKGPGEGEQPLVDAVDGEGGPLRGFLEALGVVEPLPEQDPEQTVAEAEAEAVEAEDLQMVRIASFSAQDLPQIVQLRGRTEASAKIAVRAETNGTVEQVHVAKGDTVAAGDLLCTLDQGTRRARLATAESQLEQARADLESNAALRERGIAPANTARQYQVALRSAEANYDEAVAELERTELRAESGGVVQDPLADVGDFLSAGGECATIVQLDPMLFSGQIAEARVGQLTVGERAQITTVTGHEVIGTVSYVGASADQATRTFPVEIEVPNPDGAIRDGVTAEALIQVATVRAHLLPQSALTLDTEGVLGVRAVEGGDTVAFHTVEIVRDTREGVWVTGLPETIEIITIGQEYVQAGETVRASYGDEA